MKRLVIAISLVMAILAIANPIPGQAQKASAPEQQAKNNGAAPSRWASVQSRQGTVLAGWGATEFKEVFQRETQKDKHP